MMRNEFVDRYGGIYEHSPWVAEQVWDTGLSGDLATRMAAAVDMAGKAAQLKLLRAHPDLAGKLARAGGLTSASTAEQAGAGLDRCTDAEFEEFVALNDAYKAKFGFPFILAVKGRNRQEILENFRSRIGNDADVEFRTALAQVHRIAALRLAALDQA
jgi:2-oxo-4-hydroxy-4-carboxy-5-ureidoimidazoline decarboxylase